MPLSEYQELLEKRRKLDEEISAALADSRPKAIEDCRDMIATFKLTEKELFGALGKTGARSPAVAKFRDPETGATWSGRGKAPRWLQGDRERYLIAG